MSTTEGEDEEGSSTTLPRAEYIQDVEAHIAGDRFDPLVTWI